MFLSELRPVRRQDCLEVLLPLLEAALRQRSVVDHVRDLLPLFRVALLLSHDAGCLLEVVSLRPQLAIQRFALRKQLGEPVRREEG